MRRPKEGHYDERELVRAKANYAAAGEETVLRIIYQHGLFVTADTANNIAVESAKEHLRNLVDAAWNAKRPYTSKAGHARNIRVAGLQDLIDRGVNKTIALQAIREAVYGDDIYIMKSHGVTGYRCQKADE